MIQKYNIEVEQYTQSVAIESLCNSITFKNIGAAPFKINKITLAIGEDLRIDGNVNEMDVTNYTLDVQGSGVAICLVVRKKYC